MTDPENDTVSCNISEMAPPATVFDIWLGSTGMWHKPRDDKKTVGQLHSEIIDISLKIVRLFLQEGC